MGYEHVLRYVITFFLLGLLAWITPALYRWRQQTCRTQGQQDEYEDQLERSAAILASQEEQQERYGRLLARWDELTDRAESVLDKLMKQ